MFPDGYNLPFYSSYGVPGIGMNMGTRMGMRAAASRTGGLFSRLSGIRNINWQGLRNNTSRTLGIINQAIPIVKQVGPMYNNMKSMLRIASLFKDETDPSPRKTTSNITNNNSNVNTNDSNTNAISEEKENTIINNNYSNSPSFFI